MKPRIQNTAIFLLLIFSFTSCYKKSEESLVEKSDFLSEARAYFENHVDLKTKPVAVETKNPRHDLARKPNWAGAETIKFRGKEALSIPIQYTNPFVIFSNFSKKAYSVNDLTRLIVFRTHNGAFEYEVVTYFPDKNYSGSKFSGLTMIETWDGELLNEFKFSIDGKTKKLDFEKQKAGGKNKDDINPNLVITVCYEISGYNYSPASGEYTYWSYSAGCESYFIDNYPPSGGNNGDEYLEPVGDGGSGGGGDGGIQPEEIVVIEDGPDPIANVVDYNKCFTNVAGSTNEYKVKLCVQQPDPGSRETWGFGANPSGNPFIVGHAFLVLTEVTPGGTITRNIGFYPDSGVNPWSTTAGGQLNNDANRGFNVSVEITMTNSQFFNILDFIAHSYNTPPPYNLNSNNCTHFVLNALGAGGFTLPRTPGSWVNGYGLNPGDLGEDIRTMSLIGNMARATANSYHPNTGTCY